MPAPRRNGRRCVARVALVPTTGVGVLLHNMLVVLTSRIVVATPLAPFVVRVMSNPFNLFSLCLRSVLLIDLLLLLLLDVTMTVSVVLSTVCKIVTLAAVAVTPCPRLIVTGLLRSLGTTSGVRRRVEIRHSCPLVARADSFWE